MRQQHRQLMHWHLAHVVPDEMNSCSQSVSTLLHLVLSVFFSADVTQKTGTLATHSEEPVIVSNSTVDTYLVGKWFISPPTNTFTPPWLFLVAPPLHARTYARTNSHAHTSACGRWSILALWHRGTCWVTEWLAMKMSTASDGVSDWANQGDGGVKSLHLSTHSITHPLIHSFRKLT